MFQFYPSLPLPLIKGKTKSYPNLGRDRTPQALSTLRGSFHKSGASWRWSAAVFQLRRSNEAAAKVMCNNWTDAMLIGHERNNKWERGRRKNRAAWPLLSPKFVAAPSPDKNPLSPRQGRKQDIRNNSPHMMSCSVRCLSTSYVRQILCCFYYCISDLPFLVLIKCFIFLLRYSYSFVSFKTYKLYIINS